MPDSLTPSPWFWDRFGDHSLAVMKAFAAAGHAAQLRSLEAKAGSGLRTNDAYGSTFWLSLPQELVTHLAFLPDAEVLHPHRSRYDLIVFNSTVIFPVKMGTDSTEPDRIKLRPSPMRHKLFSLENRESMSPPLDFGQLDSAEELGVIQDAADLGFANSMLLVAYDCTARGGVQHIYVGEAVLEDDGVVIWSYREELPLRALAEDTTTLTLVTDGPGPRFDDSPPPTTTLELRKPGETVEEEELADADEQDEGTGTENDDRA